MDRYMDSFNLVSRVYAERLRRESSNMWTVLFESDPAFIQKTCVLRTVQGSQFNHVGCGINCSRGKFKIEIHHWLWGIGRDLGLEAHIAVRGSIFLLALIQTLQGSRVWWISTTIGKTTHLTCFIGIFRLDKQVSPTDWMIHTLLLPTEDLVRHMVQLEPLIG